MSWKWIHEIEYWTWLTLFDWTYWVWKSSILVDSLDLAFSNNARNINSEMITKGEDFWYVEVYFSNNGLDYKIYWYYKPKNIKIKEIKGIKREVKTAAKTIWNTFQKIDWEYVEINQTPEQILGVSYEIAKKTFIIWQFDLDNFSEAGPSEKYEMIAESFGIDKLFEIWEKTKEKIKVKVIEKEIISKNLEGIDTVEIENLSILKTKVSEKKKQIDKTKEKEDVLISEKEQITNKSQKLNFLSNQLTSVNFHQKTLDEIKLVVNIPEIEKKLENLKKELLKHDISKLKDIEKEIWIIDNTIQIDKITFDNKLQEINNKFTIKNNSLLQSYNLLIEQYKRIQLVKKEIFTDDYKKEINNFDILKWEKQLLELENVKNKIEKSLLENNNSKILLENDKKNYNNIIAKIKQLDKVWTCPTCYKTLSESDKTLIENNFLNLISKIDENLVKVNELIAIDNKSLSENNKLITSINLKIENKKIYLENEIKIKEQKEISIKWKKKKAEMNELLLSKEEDIKKIEKENTDKMELNNSNRKIKEEELKEFKKNNKYFEIEENIKEIENKLYLISWVNYNIIDLKTLKETKIYLISDWNKKIEEISKEIWLKNITNELLENEKEINNKKINDLEETIKNIKDEIQNENENYLTLKIDLDRLTVMKKEYDKVKEKLEVLNKKLDQLEKISFVFWKKGEPKNIIEKIIIPQLEEKTNKILSEMTSWRYMISFSLNSLTWEWKESKRNIFDIIVYQNWVPLAYQNLSWWEKTNVNFSIRLGITESLNDLLWKKINDFIILDETFNSVDEQEGGENVITAINELNNSWRFNQIFIITHVTYIQEKLEDFSNVIRIEKKGKYSQII